jgi:hypothetical protein
LLHQNPTEDLQENLEYPLNSDMIPLGTLEPSQLNSPKAYSLFTGKKISSVKCFTNRKYTVTSKGVSEIQYEAKKEMSQVQEQSVLLLAISLSQYPEGLPLQ